MNPSLRNPYMLAHPPMLYLGYVGLTIPFAFAMAALLSRRVDERWIVATRRWTLAAWACLGVGILLGAKWAYEEVGWGGWYAWDPVENAALMPWLVATAFLHSVMVQEKKNMLRVWNAVLVAGAFCLSLFGTFLTRSGVINSIHSFTQSSIGAWFLGFIAVVAAASTALILYRLPMLRSRTRLESLVSREAAFLYNNLFLVALALTVLWGVVYPLVSAAVRGPVRWPAWSGGTDAATAVTSSTRRSSCSSSARSASAASRPLARRSWRRASPRRSARTRSRTSAPCSDGRRTRWRSGRTWPSTGTGRTSARSWRARTATSPSSRRRTRSRFDLTGCGQKTFL